MSLVTLQVMTDEEIAARAAAISAIRRSAAPVVTGADRP